MSLLADAINEMEKFEGELAIKRAGLQALRLNAADPSTLMQLKGVCMRACVHVCVIGLILTDDVAKTSVL